MSDDFKLESSEATVITATLPDPAFVLGQRLNRREIQLVKALDDMARAVDDDVPLFWFSKVFTGWIAPQSQDRKARINQVLMVAVRCCPPPPPPEPAPDATQG